MAGAVSRRASALAVVVLCLLLATRISAVVAAGQPGQVPFTVALFVPPLACAVPVTRRLVDRYRWPALAVQGVLTWVPFAVFGGRWQYGIGGLLAGLVLLTVTGRVAWLAAGALLAAEVGLRAAVTGLPYAPAWDGVLVVVTFYVDDALVFFGMVRLAQIVGQVEDARGRAAGLAIAGERLRAAGDLQAAVGQRLAGIIAAAAAARRALSRDAAAARGQIAAAGAAARDAVAQARAITISDRLLPRLDPAGRPEGAVIGARLARAVLVTVLLAYAAVNSGYIIAGHLGPGPMAVGDIALVTVLQLYQSLAGRQGRRPRLWPATLALQAVLVYAFAFPFAPPYVGTLAPFLAGSMLLLVPGWWRWAGYATVVASWPALNGAMGRLGVTAGGGEPVPAVISLATNFAAFGLLVYGLARLAGQAAELESIQGELARIAAVRERLRIARDVHDLLGLGLSAIALKTDLIGALIGRDDVRAADEIGELARTCAAARADARMVATGSQRLTLGDELATARQILATADVNLHATITASPLPATADEVLAPVLREAVTNILRHSAATTCAIELAADHGTLRLTIGNDGVTGQAADGSPLSLPPTGNAAGRGLANLTGRVEAAGGRLTSGQADGRFDLTAEIPLPGPARAQLPGEGD